MIYNKTCVDTKCYQINLYHKRKQRFMFVGVCLFVGFKNAKSHELAKTAIVWILVDHKIKVENESMSMLPNKCHIKYHSVRFISAL